MPYLIRAACLTDYVEVARSVGLEPNRMIDAVGLPQASLHNPDLKISLAAFTRLLEVSAKAARVDDFGLRLSERRLLSNLGPLDSWFASNVAFMRPCKPSPGILNSTVIRSAEDA